MEYEELLKKAYKKVKLVDKGSERFEIPKAQGSVSGKNTFITNISQIASYLRRKTEHLTKFLQKELAVPTTLKNNQLSIKSRLNSLKVNEKIQKYAKEFVVCPVCGKPDTELLTEKSIKIKHCLACGAKSPVKYNL